MSQLFARAHGRTVCSPSVALSPDPRESRPFVLDLLRTSVLLAEDWEALDIRTRDTIEQCAHRDDALAQLVRHGLLTSYQAARLSAGSTYGLVLGRYRVLERLGAGGMAVVFKCEHIDMRHMVAIKVLPLTPGQDPRMQARFMAEMRTVARLRHPNIVGAMDAGHLNGGDPDQPTLQYLVMEYVPGQDLEELVRTTGPLKPTRACNLIHQIASALGETHKFQLVHRDVKPSNILVTPEDQAKLLDFGLSRGFDTRVTQPGTVLGTVDFMAPEQGRDASTVDIRADIYGLGGTLYWCLTGQLPFECEDCPAESLMRRNNDHPPSAREVSKEVSAELDAVVQRMMAPDPEDRFPTPQAVMRALLPFLKCDSTECAGYMLPSNAAAADRAQNAVAIAEPQHHRVLVVDDEPGVREFCKAVIKAGAVDCTEAVCAGDALEAASKAPFDLVLLDVNLPDLSGFEVLKRLRENPPSPHLKVIMFSGMATADEMARMLLAGADDYLTKPFSVIQLQGRIQTSLRLKAAQDRSALLNKRLLRVNAELENNLDSRDSDLVHSRNALVLALAKLVEHRDNETGAHLARLQRYGRCLAEKAAKFPMFESQIDQPFIEMLECCSPLHDIGKVGLPDHILLKPGKLTADERIQMQAHTIMGSDTLREVAQQHGAALAFLQMAIDITRHHHERFDGTGYPDRLVGAAIPLAARIVAICDVYDALRCRKVYKPALAHAAAVQVITEASPGHFDPALLQAFLACASQFDQVFGEIPD
jgi:response regulator RpfG family c-di-GMP phosphodiesterase